MWNKNSCKEKIINRKMTCLSVSQILLDYVQVLVVAKLSLHIHC